MERKAEDRIEYRTIGSSIRLACRGRHIWHMALGIVVVTANIAFEAAAQVIIKD